MYMGAKSFTCWAFAMYTTYLTGFFFQKALGLVANGLLGTGALLWMLYIYTLKHMHSVHWNNYMYTMKKIE